MIAQYTTFAMAAILVLAMALELRTGRIPNWLSLLPPLVFLAVLVISDDRIVLYWQIGIAAAVFVMGFVLFLFAGLGAGAVKLMAGLALFVPFEKGGYTLLIFVVAFVVVSIVTQKMRKSFGSTDSKWPFLSKPVVPTSLPIGIAGLCALFLL